MRVEVVRHFEDAEASSLKVELFRDRDMFVRAWYIGPLIRMAKEFVLPLAPREQNLRAETAIAQVVDIALFTGLMVAVIDPQHLWEELSLGQRITNPFSALLDPPAEDRRRHDDQFVARRSRATDPRRDGCGESKSSSQKRRSRTCSDDDRRKDE